MPEGAIGIVLFAHGSGSGRHSPRNRSVARALNRAGLGTLLFDLLTERESRRPRQRVRRRPARGRGSSAATKWLRGSIAYGHLPLGYFGASTGAGAALGAAARADVDVDAVVSRGGRPDLASRHLAAVHGADAPDRGRRRPGRDRAEPRGRRRLLHCEHRLEIVHGATHLFEEPGRARDGGRSRHAVVHAASRTRARDESDAGTEPVAMTADVVTDRRSRAVAARDRQPVPVPS